MDFSTIKTSWQGKRIKSIMSKAIKIIIFNSMVLLIYSSFNKPCYAENNTTVGISEIYDPVWTIDSDFWNFTCNKTLSSEGIIDAAYSPTLKQWICLLSAGDILVSKDLKNWKRYNMGNRYEMSSIMWTDDKYIACGDILLYSKDGIKWYDANVKISYLKSAQYGRGLEYDTLFNIYWNGSQYLAYGTNKISALLYTSEDGINWKAPDSEKEDYTIGWDFCWNGSSWLAVGNEKATLCNNEEKWKETNVSSLTLRDSSQELALVKCIWTGKEFYAIDENGAICTSKDGKKWNVEKGTIYSTNITYTDLIWTGKILLAYGHNQTYSSIAYSCITGGKWKEVALPFSVQCIKQVDNKLYAFSDNPYSASSFVASSTDGLKWKTVKTNSSFEGVENVEYANGNFYIQSNNRFKVYLSKDGVKLKEVNIIGKIDDIAASKKLWLAISYGRLYQSTDGINFEYVDNIDYNNTFNAITSFSGGWCIVGNNGVIFTSKNGTKFKKVKSPTKNNLTSIYSDGKLLIAGGENGTIIVSKDKGATWSIAYNKLKGMKVIEIMNGNGIFMASLTGDTYKYNKEMYTGLMSKDGVTWKIIGIPKFCKKITYFKGYFLALVNCFNISSYTTNSEYWCSKDGEHWVNHNLEDSKQNIEEAVIGNNLMMMWNSDGELLMTDGSGQNIQSNVTVKGIITLPEGMFANEDGIEITMTVNSSNINVPGRTCGQSVIKIEPGKNTIEYSMPIKLTKAEQNANNKNISFTISVQVKNTMDLASQFYIFIVKDATLFDEMNKISLLPNTYTFKDAEFETMIRDLLKVPTKSILTERFLSTSVIVLKKFNSHMVEDINQMTALKQIIVPSEYLQEIDTYYPNKDIITYDYSEDMYWWYIDYTIFGQRLFHKY